MLSAMTTDAPLAWTRPASRYSIRIWRAFVRTSDEELFARAVIPREIEAELFEGAWSKAHGEKRVFEAIKSVTSAQEAWDRYRMF